MNGRYKTVSKRQRVRNSKTHITGVSECEVREQVKGIFKEMSMYLLKLIQRHYATNLKSYKPKETNKKTIPRHIKKGGRKRKTVLKATRGGKKTTRLSSKE